MELVMELSGFLSGQAELNVDDSLKIRYLKPDGRPEQYHQRIPQEVTMHPATSATRVAPGLVMIVMIATFVHAPAWARQADARKHQLIEQVIASGIGHIAGEVTRNTMYAGMRSGCIAPDTAPPESNVTAREQLIREYLGRMKVDDLEAIAGMISDPRMGGVMKLFEALMQIGTLDAIGETQKVLTRIQEARPEGVRRVMADIRSVATAVESFSTDRDIYPDAATIEELGKHVSPFYIRNMPLLDSWGTPYAYVRLEGGGGYRIASAGPDRRFDTFTLNEYVEIQPLQSRGDDYDIVYETGTFIRFPEEAASR